MKKKTMRFLFISLIAVLLLCIVIFTAMTRFMIQKSNNAINRIGNIYMSEMSTQLQRHFSTIINLRLSQAEGILESTPPENAVYGEALLSRLAANASVRNFSYLALYSTDGTAEVVYGEPVSITEEESFRASLNNDEEKLGLAFTASGEKLLLLGISAEYPMGGQKTCTALVAGLPLSEINDALSLDVDETLIYSHIIRKNGEFILQNGDADTRNYFDQLLEMTDFNGQSTKEAVADLRSAMEQGQDYSAMLTEDQEHCHLYLTPLSHSDWYLCTVMPYGILDQTITKLGDERMYSAFAGCAAILVVLLGVFAFYALLSHRQLSALDAAKKEAEKASLAKSEFLSNMSHDIRTPMNAIIGMTAIATANQDNPEQIRDCLRKITVSSHHLLGLINDVLDMSKIESGKLTLNPDFLSLKETMENIVTIIQPQIRSRNQNFDILIHNIEHENVFCDSVRLNQVLLNLLSNAVKFTPENGSITVSVDQEPCPLDTSSVRVHFRVRDTGIGMSHAFQERIFEAFVRETDSRVNKTEGTGLGMAITKYIVDMMNGTIELESEEGKGSEFHVTLDLPIADTPCEDMQLPSVRMLVVDDDEELCRSTARSLSEIGIQANWTKSGETAVQLARENHLNGDDFQIILIDWKMPGMDGLETARKIRAEVGCEVPILLISAYDWSELEAEAEGVTVNGFLSKPLFKSTLFYGLRPFVQPDKAADEPDVSDSFADFTGRRVLLAEDNDLNWEIAQELLSSLGLTLDRAENGKICTELFAASSPGYYQAILMDIRMPVMNGYEATQMIRSMDRPDASIPIIAMTADAFAEDIRHCMETGMNGHVAKPINLPELTRLLQKYL